MRTSLAIIAAAFALPSALATPSVTQDDRPQPATVAERSEFRETARHTEVLAFIDELSRRYAHVRRLDFGTTVEGRPITAAIVANPPVSTPVEAATSSKLVMLIIGNIHSGECDGKEALLAIIRELAITPDHPLLKHFVLLIVPNFNADGNEKMAANNRPGQVGPELMGRRENAQGLDLNRDFVKLETPEVRSLIQLMNVWNPDGFIDCHTTNGSRHRYALTFDSPHNPAAASTVREFTREIMLPDVMRRLEAKDISTFFYGNFDRAYSQWSSYGHEPRYGIEYVGLRGRIAILAESYSYKSYRDRIEATRAIVLECLQYLGEHRDHVLAMLPRGGRPEAPRQAAPANDRIAIRSKLASRHEKVVVRGFEREPRPAGTPVAPPSKESRPKDYTVDQVDRAVPTLEVIRPLAYVIPSDLSRIADKLLRHGVSLMQLARSASCDFEVYTVNNFDASASPFQRHRLRTANVTMRSERRDVPAGTFIVPCNQPLGNLATYLLEPASDDGFVAWNEFDHVVRAGLEYPVLRLTAGELVVRPVDKVEPSEKLNLDQIYGTEHAVAFAGAQNPAPRWLPGGSHYVEVLSNRLMRTNAETTETRPSMESKQQTPGPLPPVPVLTLTQPVLPR
jgi:murein tripeptide amidase MpaA